MGTLTNTNDFTNSGRQPNMRTKKSIVWDHFTVEGEKAVCNLCKKSLAYISSKKLAGTSHLRRHFSSHIPSASGLCTQNTNMSCISTPDAKPRVSSDRAKKRFKTTPFDQDRCNRDIAKLIIQCDYPIHMVEDMHFISFVRSLQPQFSLVNASTIEEHIKDIYFKTKQGLVNLLAEIPGRISLTLDSLVSNGSLGCVFLTGHFVDCDWKLQRRMMKVITSPYLDSKNALDHALSACIADWNLSNKLFTLTLDNAYINESSKEDLRGLMSVTNPDILNGQLILSSCYARTFSDLAHDALMLCRETVEKVRQNVFYIKSSLVCEEKFMQLKQQLQVPCMKNLILDDLTKWDTTYHMLLVAYEFRKVFSCLDNAGPDYASTVSMEEWKQVETLCIHLSYFYDAVNLLTAPVYPTSNEFFYEVWKIQLELMHGTMSQDPLVRYITKPLFEKFDRYWRDCCLVLATAVIMDPRFKMKIVELSFKKIYGADAGTWIKIIDEGVHDLFLEYVVGSHPMTTFDEYPHDSVERSDIAQDEDFLITFNFDPDFGYMNTQHMKLELDHYLEECLLPWVQGLDVLGWWKINESKYPILSKMASDILCIPVSTLSPDSVFDTSDRRVDNYRRSLHPHTLEALVCAKDWLQYERSEASLESPSAIIKKENIN